MKFNQIQVIFMTSALLIWQIDLVFACISLPKIGDDFDLDNYEILSKLEDTALRSLNGRHPLFLDLTFRPTGLPRYP